MTGIGGKIRLAREAKGWNQDTLAERLGVEIPTISRWENGVHRPRAKQISALAEVLERAPDWFLQPLIPEAAPSNDSAESLRRASEALNARMADIEAKLEALSHAQAAAADQALFKTLLDKFGRDGLETLSKLPVEMALGLLRLTSPLSGDSIQALVESLAEDLTEERLRQIEPQASPAVKSQKGG